MEVGKTYRDKYDTIGRPFKVLFVGKKAAFVRYEIPNGLEMSITKNYWDDYVEFKKPRSGKRFVNIMENGDNPPFSISWATRKAADETAGKTRIACIEVDWTEGEGL